MINYLDILIDWSMECDDWNILCFSDKNMKKSDTFLECITSGISMKSKYYNWLNDHTVIYHTSVVSDNNENYFRIHFKKPEDLVLFKLTFL